MIDSSTRNVQIIATAFHEAGHVVAALQVGCNIRGMSVSFDRPGDGLTIRDKPKMSNPIHPGSTPESALSAWNYALENIQKEMKIFLAGPIAEAKFLGGDPLRLRGADQDRFNCQRLSNRLNTLNEFYRGFYPIPRVQGHKVLNQVRVSTSKWIDSPKIWTAIMTIGVKAARVGALDSSEIRYLIGKADGTGHQRSMNLL